MDRWRRTPTLTKLLREATTSAVLMDDPAPLISSLTKDEGFNLFNLFVYF